MACEQLLSHLWDRFAIDNSLDAEHERDLREGRAFNAATRAETLRVAGILSGKTYTLLTAARRHRNELAHNGEIGDEADTDAIKAMYAMLSAVLDHPSDTESPGDVTGDLGRVAPR
jgi:hypothetical protein